MEVVTPPPGSEFVLLRQAVGVAVSFLGAGFKKLVTATPHFLGHVAWDPSHCSGRQSSRFVQSPLGVDPRPLALGCSPSGAGTVELSQLGPQGAEPSSLAKPLLG